MRERRRHRVGRVGFAALRATRGLGLVVAAGLSLTACSHGNRFMPAQPGPAGICYYVSTPAECANRGVAGTPTLITSDWFSTYYPYYSSSYYSSTYVPPDDQTDYQNDVSTFQSENEDSISSDDAGGDWVDTSGNTWSGSSTDDPSSSDDSSSDDGGDDSGGDSGGFDDGGGDSGGDDGGDDGGGDDGGDD